MEGISIIIPVFNKFETTRRCIEHIREFNRAAAYEIIIVDNGSTDGTSNVIARGEIPRLSLRGSQGEPKQSQDMLGTGSAILVDEIASPSARNDKKSKITCIRNDENFGVAKALNIGARAAKYDVLCFMHNDVFVHEKNWSVKIGDFIVKTPNVGIAGLYGAKTLRRDGSFRGRTIVHAKKEGPSINRPFEKVAVVDGLLMAMKRPVLEKIGGFREEFGVHYYDKDISMRAAGNGFSNYVLNVPFEHTCGTTRNQLKRDDAIRDGAQKRFIEIWKDALPANINTWREKIGRLLQK
ncbi:MAG: glycosyltransferase [Nitrospiraceae bacterium]|nr:MAG: glycosyltransferase [Nitrospiraceae bacterium]